jgi:hypothetical protein
MKENSCKKGFVDVLKPVKVVEKQKPIGSA